MKRRPSKPDSYSFDREIALTWLGALLLLGLCFAIGAGYVSPFELYEMARRALP